MAFDKQSGEVSLEDLWDLFLVYNDGVEMKYYLSCYVDGTFCMRQEWNTSTVMFFADREHLKIYLSEKLNMEIGNTAKVKQEECNVRAE